MFANSNITQTMPTESTLPNSPQGILQQQAKGILKPSSKNQIQQRPPNEQQKQLKLSISPEYCEPINLYSKTTTSQSMHYPFCESQNNFNSQVPQLCPKPIKKKPCPTTKVKKCKVEIPKFEHKPAPEYTPVDLDQKVKKFQQLMNEKSIKENYKISQKAEIKADNQTKKLQKQNYDLKEQVAKYKQLFEEEFLKNQLIEDTKLDLERKIKNIEAQLQLIQEEKIKFQSEAIEYKTKFTTLKPILSLKESTIEQLQYQATQQVKEKNDLMVEIAQLRQQLVALNSKYQELCDVNQRNTDQLSFQLGKVKNDMEFQYDNDIRKLQARNKTLESQINELQCEMRQQIQPYEIQVQSYISESKALKYEISQLNFQLQTIIYCQKQQEDQNCQIQFYNQQDFQSQQQLYFSLVMICLDRSYLYIIKWKHLSLYFQIKIDFRN